MRYSNITFYPQQLTQAQHCRGRRPERTLQEDVDGRQQGPLAARRAPRQPAARAYTQLELQRKHAQQVTGELPVHVRPYANAGVGHVSEEAGHRGAWWIDSPENHAKADQSGQASGQSS